ncbi:MAG: ATP-dependent RecD-like DNA helicase [Clostridia bacterium]|nr:ATP-dependent RecD-like DNA helicase [Clostridia bacterium]
MDTMERLTGIVEEVIYYNDENGYGVIVLDISGEYVNVAGNLPMIAEGERICAYGKWVEHPKFGEQFQCEYYEPHFDNDTTSVYKFLASGFIRGVGNATAKKIVDKFSEETLDIIEKYPERLSEISGISLTKAMDIHKDYMKKIEIQNVVSYFVKYGISPSVAVKVYNTLGGSAIKLCNENPYIICERVEKIGFLTVDKIAEEMGIPKNSMERLKAGITYVLYQETINGHTCYPKEELLEEACKLLSISQTDGENALMLLLREGKLVSCKKGDIFYYSLPHFYLAESYIASRLMAIATAKCENWSKKISVDQLTDITLSPEQTEAIEAALREKVLIITGGPGTGKTTVIKSLITAFDALSKRVILAAPTGRAAKRISELTGKNAKTIHRLLELKYTKGERPEFLKNEQNPILCDVLIVDEMSMTDSLLFESLLRAVKEKTRLILVGDCDQLPPVGAGNVLKDMIASQQIKRVNFNQIFRQNHTSRIVENAHRILNFQEPLYNETDSDFFFVSSSNGETAVSAVCDLVENRLPNFLKIPPDRIQVLTPMRKSVLGSVALNNALKQTLNPVRKGQPFKTANGYTFSKFDRVMQTKNDYEIIWETKAGIAGEGIYNGDMGVITEIDLENKEMTILFDDEKIVKYEFLKLENLELAYAVTVHKSQGSEFDAVVIPLVYGYPQLMTQNLLYTAVTRAKTFVCIVGRKGCVTEMIHNNTEQKRYTNLADFLIGTKDDPF